MVLFNGILALVSILTFRVLRRQTRISEKADSRTQVLERPWVGIEMGKQFGFDDFNRMILPDADAIAIAKDFGGFKLGIRVIFRNGGRTVARVHEIIADLDVFPERTLPADPESWGTLLPPQAERLLAPGGIYRQWAWRVLDKDEMEGVARGTLSLTLMASARYDDGFGTQPRPISVMCLAGVRVYDIHGQQWFLDFWPVGGDGYNRYT